MSGSDNVQRSETVIAAILAHLMQRGIQHGGIQFAELGLEEDYQPFFLPCFEWLMSEGLIRFKSSKNVGWRHGGPVVLEPTLTSLGYRYLGEPMLAGDADQKLGEVVKDVAKGGENFAQFGDFFGGLLGGFTKSMGG
ncbi:MAG: hypothetical protein HRU32_12825 [Rhodobacteraceae bacterium]|nr:hypothetical protein [Paracoccaceae bacterium]